MYAVSHGSCSQDYVKKSRKPNILWLLTLLSMAVLVTGQQREKGETSVDQGDDHLWLWLAILALLRVLFMIGVFFAGRWSFRKDTRISPRPRKPRFKRTNR